MGGTAPSLAAAPGARFTEQPEDAGFPATPFRRVPESACGVPTMLAARGLARGPEPDPWLGEDKLKHFLLSFAVTSMGYAAARTVGLAHGAALGAAAGAGAAAGIWKELHDRAAGGDVSARDLTWDAVGIAAGGVLAAHTR